MEQYIIKGGNPLVGEVECGACDSGSSDHDRRDRSD